MRVPIDRPLRVCFMIERLFPAGVELQLLLLLKSLDRSRISPYLCLLDGAGKESRALEPRDCPVVRLGVRRLLHPGNLGSAWRFVRFCRANRIDMLHALLPDSLYFGAPLAKLAGVPCVAGFRVGVDEWETTKYRRLASRIYRLVDGTVANCEACRRAVVADHDVQPESVTIIPNGVELSRFAAYGEKPPSSNGSAAQRVGIVANLRPIKNIELFIRAAKLLATAHPHAHFEIAGEGEVRGRLESLIDGLGLGGRVTLRGTVSDVPAFLHGLDVAVLCSLCEGAPNAIMEYMAAGLPTVATDVGGNAEIVEHEVTGLVVPSNDEQRLAAAIDRLLRDRAFAARLGATARKRAFTEYSVEVQTRRYEEFYLCTYRKKTASAASARSTSK
jgi:L-malate glycosyltransferase